MTSTAAKPARYALAAAIGTWHADTMARPRPAISDTADPAGTVDVLVIGAGISGAAVAYELSDDHSVMILDMEAVAGHHTTGRSAATFLESYGGPIVRALTRSSRSFMEQAPLTQAPILTPLGVLWVTDDTARDDTTALHEEVCATVPNCRLLTGRQAEDASPILRPGWCAGAVFEPDAKEIDVHALHQGYLAAVRRAGGSIRTRARVVSGERSGGSWQVHLADGSCILADQVVNAAGAWADEIAVAFGVPPVGLVPMRRTAFLARRPVHLHGNLPLTCALDDSWYVVPRPGALMCSPADQTPRPPCDERPDEIQIARAIEAINQATTLEIRGIESPWAGQRTFAPDRIPVAGQDPEVSGFAWHAGQGGYGVQLAPALARVTAALVRGEPIPQDLQDQGVEAQSLAPGRLRAS